MIKSRFIDLAIRAAKKSSHPQHRIGSVLVKGNKVLSFGFNELKTHPRSTHPWKSIHSEFATILGLDRTEIEGSTIYVVRVRKDGTLGMAKPCEFCYKMLTNLNLYSIIYSTDKEFIEVTL
jgi:deoxycytidylate deaminase